MNWKETNHNGIVWKGNYVHNWFSNFIHSPFELDYKTWDTVEHYYQASKSTNPEVMNFIRISKTPGIAKRRGAKCQLRPDWEEVKKRVMYRALWAKWSQPEWREKLLSTGDETLVEWNNWKDQYWGATLDGYGKNTLGLLLMEIRDSLKTNNAARKARKK